jgi:hypothetical protein
MLGGEGMGRVYRIWGGGDLEERDYLDDPDVDGSLIIKWILKRLDRAWIGFI